MSKLTSYISASDGLIQPSGATAGQTLTWNASTGQFEPTTPSSTPGANSVTSAMLVDGTIQTNDLDNSTITSDKLASDSVNFTKIAPLPPNSLMGNPFGATNNPSSIVLGTNLSFSGLTLNATSGSGQEFPAWSPNTAYLEGDSVSMFTATWGNWYMIRNAPGTSGAILDATELGQWRYLGQAQTFTWQPSQLVPQGLKIVEGGRYWERLASGTTQPPGLGFDTAEQANWTALTPAIPAPLPIFNNNQVLRGNGSNIPSSDGRITFDIAAGAVDISATGSGNLTLGSGSTGVINVGNSTKTTTLNGIVKRPNMATLYTTGVGQALPANGAVAVSWNAAVITIGSGITVSGTAITLSRTGIYRVYGGISITSATTNTRGIIAPVAGTAGFTSPSSRAVRQTTANIATENSYEFLLNVTTAGTFSIGCTMVAASTIQAFNSTTATAATTTLYIQEIG